MKENCHSSWKGEKPFLSSLSHNKLYLCGGIKRQNQKTYGPQILLLVQKSQIVN